jgi:hypothetical protein
MKKTISILALTVVMVSFAICNVSAQTNKTTFQQNGYFVLESNKTDKKATTVRFYNDNNVLVYEEKVTGVKFNLNRTKTLDKLNEGLEKALLAWNEKQETLRRKDWVAVLVKK